MYNRPVNPMGVSLLPHFLCRSKIFSKSYSLRSVTVVVVLLGASFTGLSQYLLGLLLEELEQPTILP